MTANTLLLIIGAAIVALCIAGFQYYFKAKYKTSRNLVYAVLRFLSVFTILLLLINPQYKKKSFYIEKPALAVAIDNSESIAFLGYQDSVNAALERFRESELLNETFDIQYYSFDENTQLADSLRFDKKQTDIAQVFKSFSAIYKGDIAPTVVLSDGNQTLGTSFVYSTRNYKHPVYPIAIGDTIVYDDLKLGQLNVNRYAYINNKFPVELFTSYNGTRNIQSNLVVRYAGRVVHRERLSFSPDTPSQVANFLLDADQVGVRQYTVSLEPIENEKNTKNNAKSFAIEVIDQKTKVAIISAIVHPDIGVLKKSIESNRLRSVTLLDPLESQRAIDDYDVVVLYQPDLEFETVYDALDRLDKNRIVITGTKTNWQYLNRQQQTVRQEITGQEEEVQAVLNPNFSTFTIAPIGFEDYPPLQAEFGEATINSTNDVALYQKVSGIDSEYPLLVTTEENSKRAIWLFGEGIWRWRAQSYIDTRSFEVFDSFIDQLVQYTASKRKKSRFNVDFESFYYGTSGVQMNAQYFDKNYVFDNRAIITLSLIHI